MWYNTDMTKKLSTTEMRYRSMLQRVKLKPGQYGRRGLYLDKGICVCERWMPDGNGNGYRNFLKDMGECPDGMTLDRIDNGKGYSPDNCRWTNWHIQNSNRSNSNDCVGVFFDGKYWRASLRVNGKIVLQTRRKTKESAIAARREAENKYHIYD